ncbi:hypothetical protein BJY04DRAFT_142378 [Aspergillus karnatakaensis]|uniref:uncharacterized protein n=1 Tax=Aspergillus karnatakaensis TaxID=1810916 RepID=UPI003CCDABDF
MDGANEPSPKRKRLSYACNYCRQKKTRCDEQQPSCRNCRIAGVACITTDKRRAGVVVSHRRRQSRLESQSMNTPESQPEPSPVPSTRNRPVPTQCWDRSAWQSGRLPMIPRCGGASMFEIMTEWLDLAFYRLRVPAPYSALQSTAVAPRPGISLPQTAPTLPSAEDLRVFIDRYLDTFHHIFPFLSAADLSELGEMVSLQSASHQALTYLVAIVGLMMETASSQSKPTISAYIEYINNLLGHLVVERSLRSVQAIMLFAMVLRSADRIATAWDVLCLGVSMAQSLGVNQGSFPRSPESTQSHDTWWCMYVFEKILAFETGRTSMVWDRELSRFFRQTDRPEQPEHSPFLSTYKHTCVSLANTLHEIQDRAAGAWRREEWTPQSVEEAIEEKITTGGELATLLQKWWEELPSEYWYVIPWSQVLPADTISPGPAAVADRGASQRLAFLAFYYHHATIMLNRSVLLIETTEMQEVIERHASEKPWRHRIANGGRVCVEAARELVKLTVALVDAGLPSYLTTLTTPLIAVYTLAVHIIRERHSLLVRSDLELMKAAIAVTSHHYQQLENAQDVDDVLTALERYAAECIQGQTPQPFETATGGEGFSSLISLSQTDSAIANSVWGPSALDWAGWDWTDLSHLLESAD